MRKVSDLEKSLRKLGLYLLTPNDFYSDKLSFEYCNKVLYVLKSEKKILEKMDVNDTIETFEKFYDEIHKTFQFHNFSTCGNLERSILNKGFSDELDKYDQCSNDHYLMLKTIAERFSKLLDGSETSVKLDFDERNHWFLYCTNKRSETFKERLTNLNGKAIHLKDENEKTIQTFTKDDFTFKRRIVQAQ